MYLLFWQLPFSCNSSWFLSILWEGTSSVVTTAWLEKTRNCIESNVILLTWMYCVIYFRQFHMIWLHAAVISEIRMWWYNNFSTLPVNLNIMQYIRNVFDVVNTFRNSIKTSHAGNNNVFTSILDLLSGGTGRPRFSTRSGFVVVVVQMSYSNTTIYGN